MIEIIVEVDSGANQNSYKTSAKTIFVGSNPTLGTMGFSAGQWFLHRAVVIGGFTSIGFDSQRIHKMFFLLVTSNQTSKTSYGNKVAIGLLHQTVNLAT